ncbi:hypothetical protein OG426_41060 [Streptomyces canus]|uniref:hypothetical protein n=1 Tax=Streptomyces canus TaxID=58343 RepID=UPI0038649543|nr:hypothetical protein OG426_41060 [Streptomyces canus]
MPSPLIADVEGEGVLKVARREADSAAPMHTRVVQEHPEDLGDGSARNADIDRYVTGLALQRVTEPDRPRERGRRSTSSKA